MVGPVALLLGGCAGPGADDSGTELFPWPPVGPLPRDTLVIPEQQGVTFLGLDGTVVLSAFWPQLVGSCPVCGGEGSSVDGDALLLSFTTDSRQGRPGAVARVTIDGALDWRVDGFGFPHDVIRDPADDSILVVATFSGAVHWIAGDGSSNAPIRSLTTRNPEFPATPNGAELVVHEGRNYLLLSHRPQEMGRITFWDITEPGAPQFLWRFPASGALGIPHDPTLRQRDGRWWLLWAHTRGRVDGSGTVGLAVTDDLRVRPDYVVDLEPEDDIVRLARVRGVELLSDDTLVVTDSGPGGSVGQGRVFAAQFPDPTPEPSGRTGGLGDQVYATLGPASRLVGGLGSPFEARYWPDQEP